MVLSEFLAEWNNSEDRILVHTSGSTGQPKPLLVEKRRMEASAKVTCSFLGLGSGDTALLCMPLDYIAGKMVVVRSIICGMHLVEVEPSGNPLKSLDVAPSFAAMVPMQVFNSLNDTHDRKLLMQIKQLIIGGGAIDDDMAKILKEFPNAIWSTYGMTETLSHIALRRLSGNNASEWYTPFESINISIGTDGCLVIKAPDICESILKTNDRAEISTDGKKFRIIGRKDNVIDSGGIKIQIEEVEKKLRPYIHIPYIITKKTDKKFGEIVVMLIETSDSNINSIKKTCKQILPKYYMPKLFINVEHIPLTETGKPARLEAMKIAKRINK